MTFHNGLSNLDNFSICLRYTSAGGTGTYASHAHVDAAGVYPLPAPWLYIYIYISKNQFGDVLFPNS